MNISNGKDLIRRHPCFSREAHHRYGRIHLPVAPVCNIKCRYCVRKFDCVNESRPGVSSRVLTAEEALERVRAVVNRDERITVVGIAGPGDPLANPSTYEVLRTARKEFPDLSFCLSTNGLLLPEKIDELVEAGLQSLTVTINASTPKTAERIYTWVQHKEKFLKDHEAAELLLRNQWEGVKAAVAAGIVAKVNTIYLPGINEEEIPVIAEAAGVLGATLMNITALIPQGDFSDLRRPKNNELSMMRLRCQEHLPQMSHCRQCRADAAGFWKEEKDMEMETFLARIGDEYLDLVHS
jgi:nitrogen fixation protein NifB